MSTERPPTIDPVAAARWAGLAGPAPSGESPWLHEEVARRMEERLEWIVSKPKRWVHWEPLRGGLQAQALLAKRYPDSECFVVETHAEQAQHARKKIAPSWWEKARWTGPSLTFGAPGRPVQMLWANMALHMAADPMALIAQWHRMIDVDGFLMFSCFGPDTLQELRRVYATMGWLSPAHEFTDMHDWGDMLVRAGFAEPVMDMERITLSYSSPQSLLAELRTLGRNLHKARFQGLRGRGWRDRLHEGLTGALAGKAQSGRLQLVFEVVYGHAFKASPKLSVRPETNVSLDEMRQSLRKVKKSEPNQ